MHVLLILVLSDDALVFSRQLVINICLKLNFKKSDKFKKIVGNPLNSTVL